MKNISKRIRWFKAVFAAAMCLCVAHPVSAKPNPKKTKSRTVRLSPDETHHDISSLIEPICREADLPGMAAVVVQGNEIVAAGVTGVRKKGDDTPITLKDKFHLGSCTKAMTATLLASLVEEGRLRWDSTIEDVFPDLAESCKPAWRNATLSQLLTHRGGAPRDLDADNLWQRLWEFDGPPLKARTMLLEGVLRQPPADEPGTKFIYSNAGFTIAGAMAEKVTKQPWEELMRRRIFTPLGMSSAGFGPPGKASKLDQPWGHSSKGKPIPPGPGADNPAAIGPAGRIHCSLPDWARFIGMHLKGERGESQFLSDESFKKLHSPAKGPGESYAMGWIVTKRPWAGPNPNVLTHAGSNTMWFAVVWIAPDKNLAVLIAANQGPPGADKACDKAAAALITDHFNRKE